jgi:hypothetical protein
MPSCVLIKVDQADGSPSRVPKFGSAGKPELVRLGDSEVGILRSGEHGSNRVILSEIKVSCGLELY